MARFFLQNESITVSSSQPSTVTGSNGSETVIVGTGTFTFDASFGRGGDTIYLGGDASSWNISRSGTQVTLTNDAGTTTITLPAGIAGTTLVFGDATRTLGIVGGQVVLGDQAIDQAVKEVTAGSNGNPTGEPDTYALTVDSPSVSEGDSGTRTLTFTATLDRPANADTTVYYQTVAGGTATANEDYVPVAGSIVFAAGQQVATVSVLVHGDTTFEADETLNVSFTGSKIINPHVVSGTIINDDTKPSNVVVLTNANDVVQVTTPSEFRAYNNTLGAGDKLQGAGSDTLTLATDNAIHSKTIAGFTTSGISAFEVTSDASSPITLDMSGTTGVTDLVNVNSTSGVAFSQLTAVPVNVVLENLTNPLSSWTAVTIRDNAVSGSSDSVNVILDNTNADYVSVGSVSSGGVSGIETVNLSTVGDAPSFLGYLNSDITNLNISADSDLTITHSLRSTIQNITVEGNGNVSTNAWGAAQGVSYTRLNGTGADTFSGSQYADTITTLDGDDYIWGQGGNDRISTGGGNDIVDVTSGSADRFSVDAGSGDDAIFAVGNFDASTISGVVQDQVDGGQGRDTLHVQAGLNDAQFQNVANIEVLHLHNGGVTTTLQGQNSAGTSYAQKAGIDTVSAVDGQSNAIDAATFSSNLTVNLTNGASNHNTVTTGSGNDVINFFGDYALTNQDYVQGGAGSDVINLYGDHDLTALPAAFAGVETLKLHSTTASTGSAVTRDTYYTGANGSSGNSNSYALALGNGNAPTNNGTLTIDGSTLLDAAALASQLGVSVNDIASGAEKITLNAETVSAYHVKALGGAAADVFYSGTGGSTFITGAGNDFINLKGGNNSVDAGTGDDTVYIQNGINTVDTGAGNDVVTAEAGNNTVNLGAGDDVMTLGQGVDQVSAGAGNDQIFAGSYLDKNDSIDGGTGGSDLLVLSGKNYTDADFTNVRNVEAFRLDSAHSLVLGKAASANTELTTIIDNSDGNSVIDASAFDRGLTFDLGQLASNGNDTIYGTQYADQVILGVGKNNLLLGAGDDVVFVENTELTIDDDINGEGGVDTIYLDNRAGAVNAAVALRDGTKGVAVENYTIYASGDVSPAIVDADHNTLTFTGGNVKSVTKVNINASALSDVNDTFHVVIDTNQQDADYSFKLEGAQAGVGVTLEKKNLGINNNIEFRGGASNDTLIIDGSDLGSTVEFSGNGGRDAIAQSGGLITDDGYIGIQKVSVLTVADSATGGLNAVLGESAGRSGLHTIVTGNGSDEVVLDDQFGLNATAAAQQGFLLVDARSDGNDVIDGSASDTKIRFLANTDRLNAQDVYVGGSGGEDALILSRSGSADLAGVSGIEFIAVTNESIGAENFVLNLATVVDDLDNTSTLTVTADGGHSGTVALGSNDSLTVNYNPVVGEHVSLTVRGGAGDDYVTGGNKKDTLSGGAGNDTLYGLAGDDILDGGEGHDILVGGLGKDTLIGGLGNDYLLGGDGDDILSGGAGIDLLYGGIGIDTLTGGAGADVFYYGSVGDSSASVAFGGQGRDTITDFESGVDKINILDMIGLPTGAEISFVGNVGSFGDAQGATRGSNGKIEVVYDTSSKVLWFDVDDNGTLNGDDLQIVVNLTSGTELQGSDVYHGAFIGSQPQTFLDQFAALNTI